MTLQARNVFERKTCISELTFFVSWVGIFIGQSIKVKHIMILLMLLVKWLRLDAFGSFRVFFSIIFEHICIKLVMKTCEPLIY